MILPRCGFVSESLGMRGRGQSSVKCSLLSPTADIQDQDLEMELSECIKHTHNHNTLRYAVLID